ncbi:hypothetical protein LTR66_002746 [Elasticomyces elasticus]|nr:hypothetical protein LTR66_002746 [Elasticomyces elasticus]
MSALNLLPRRRGPKVTTPSMTVLSLADSFGNMSLRKGNTFHSPTLTTSELVDPISSARSMPKRSATSLEALLIGAGERRVADLLTKVDRAISDESAKSLSKILQEPEMLPVPAFLLQDTRVEEPEEMGRTNACQEQHALDSGIGSSICSSEQITSEKLLRLETSTSIQSNTGLIGSHVWIGGIARMLRMHLVPRALLLTIHTGLGGHSSVSSSSSSTSAVTRSFSNVNSTNGRYLSEYAIGKIHKYIITPILQESSLREFHPLVKDVPRRIGQKEIANLRDLEKTLIFLAPDSSLSPNAYLQFCETSIRCLHTTIDHLHVSDQRLPTDRPYTNNYFLDLVEQIRKYAQILAATRERQARGEPADEMDYSPDERLSLHGGMSHNGQPAELVREKGGKTISIATTRILSDEVSFSSSAKRPMTDAFTEDEAALRSMARRKKNALPETHTCQDCGRDFKRNCDLTKHEKTHSRPWKCPNTGCKYHTLGWPTEKERDRHHNDRHSNSPDKYKCQYVVDGQSCPYSSKRESNCKQHMEKAHGYVYIRSKSNGKNKALSSRASVTSLPATPASVFGNCATPATPNLQSPSVYSLSSGNNFSRGSLLVPNTEAVLNAPVRAQQGFLPELSTDNMTDFNYDMTLFGNNMPTRYEPYTPAISDEDRRDSAVTPGTNLTFSPMSPQPLAGTSFDDAFTPDEDFMQACGFDNTPSNFFGVVDFQAPSQINGNATQASHSLGDRLTIGASAASRSFYPGVNQTTHLSPRAQPNLTFTNGVYDREMDIDEGFNDDYTQPGDFTLYNHPGSAVMSTTGEVMIPDMGGVDNFQNFGGQFDNSIHSDNHDNSAYLPTGNDTLEELFPELNDCYGRH